MPLNIAQVTMTFSPQMGGQEVYADRLNDLITAAGDEWHVFQRRRRGMSISERIIPVFAFPLLGKVIGEWDWHLFNLFLLLTQRKSLRGFDVIVSHYAIHTLPIWTWKNKVIVLSHGIEWNLSHPGLEGRIRAFVARKALARFITVANDTHYLRNLGVAIEPGTGFFTEVLPRVWVIPNCVDTNKFRPSVGLPELSEREIILVPRQITPDRGIDLAISGFALFSKQHPRCEMHIVGSPTKGGYFRKCLALARRLGIGELVHFVGQIPNDRMPAYYASTRLCVIPTLRREGTSLSALESMACGIATVSTNVAGLKDLPTVQANPDARDLAAKMQSAYADRHQIGQRQMQAVRATFNWENWKTAWNKVFRMAGVQNFSKQGGM